MLDEDYSFEIPDNLVYPKNLENYFKELLQKVNIAYAIAIKARSKGLDPATLPEIRIANDMATRVEAITGPKGIAKRIRELQNEGKEIEEIAFIIAKEIAEGKFGSQDPETIINQAIKTATAILVGGITAAPLEGITHAKIRNDGHLAVYYAGPIRSAGGTEAALTVVIADIVRRTLGLKKYEPIEREIERMIEEVILYNRFSNLQYPVSKEKIKFVLEHLPIEITGEGTIDTEVSGPYRNMPNIETNRVRGGAVLVLNDGVIAKAKKILKITEKYKIQGWNWLSDLENIKNSMENNKSNKDKIKGKVRPNSAYLNDVIAGRPVISLPSRIGGFRLRYGRSRNTGLAAVGIHPAVMILLDNFLAVGTQIKPERPGKGAIVMPVDSIEPPLVRLNDGSVVKIKDEIEALKVRDKVDKILFLGDILVAVGEFLENNHIIIPSPIVEEWWVQELEEAIKIKGWKNNFDLKDIIEKARTEPKFSLELSSKLNIPLHPRYTYFWRNIPAKMLRYLKTTLNKITQPQIPFDSKIKEIFERLFIEHQINNGMIILNKDDFIILKELMKRINIKQEDEEKNALEIMKKLDIRILDKYTAFIGARMGRPEKAKERKMKPPVNVLFPMGFAGTRTRSIIKASKGRVKSLVEAMDRFCPTCNIHTYEYKCPKCGKRTILAYRCPKCGYETIAPIDKCPKCKTEMVNYRSYEIDFSRLVREKINSLKVTLPKEVKGVVGLTSTNKAAEPLEKGIFRGKHNLFVFKDGTIRFDATDAPLTHFKPREIGVTVQELRKLGYTKDIHGRDLTNEDQIVELKVQDIIINEDGAEYLVRVSQFIDDLLVKFYGLEPFYNVKEKKDLLGRLVIGLAPHTSAGIIGRIIGFTKAKVTFAHPYWHAAKRRNCDGDEDAIILLLDGLINFSREFLPKTRGGMMDAPLVITTILNPIEVDSEVYNMEISKHLSLDFYRESQKYPLPTDIEKLIEIVERKLNKPEQYYNFGYSYETEDICSGNIASSYKQLKNMLEKIRKQFNIMSKISAVDLKEITDRIIEVHLFPDIQGNLRSYGTQQFRCSSCNKKFRRLPLSGKCPRCGSKVIQTVFQKGILKYVPTVRDLINKYGASKYNISRLEIFENTDFFILTGVNKKVDLAQLIDNISNGEEGKKSSYRREEIRKQIISLEDFL
ncbi:MAG: DNA polymerase II large subunit [Candidatus Njordarchaeum guaymaensis]